MSVEALPQWIAKMYPSKSGQDHLGLGSVSSDQILAALSPGINVLTVHPRYHSFYIFLLDEFWRREDRSNTRNAWIRFFRPRELIYSVGVLRCRAPEHGDMRNVIGSRKIEPLVNRERESFDTTFDYIDSPLGGYGLYYRSVMADSGLLFPGGPGLPYQVDVPTTRGKKLAEAFRSVIENTRYYREFFDQDEVEIPGEVIDEYISRSCLCQLRNSDAPDRSILLDTFLHAGQDAANRRATLRMLVDIARQTDGHPLDEDLFRQLVYFGEAVGGAHYEPVEAVRETFLKWRLYQAREYYSFALNALWRHLCQWGLSQRGGVQPVSLSSLWQHLDEALDFNPLVAALQLPDPDIDADSPFEDLVDWLREQTGVSGPEPGDGYGIPGPLHEHLLYAVDLEDVPGTAVTSMVTMLALIYLRFRDPEVAFRAEWSISKMGSDGRLGVDQFVRALRQRIRDQHPTIGEVTRWLFSEYIILQHQIVAASKLPDNTYRFQREGHRIRFFDLPTPVQFMNSRFNALSTTVAELGLCGKFGEELHPLAPDGERFLEAGDL